MQRAPEQFLIVEDNPAVARTLARVLCRPHTRQAVIASSVREASELSRSCNFTGIVVDLGLPDGTGFEVIALMREHRPDLPALVVTGDLRPEIANRCQLLGAEIVFKPASRANLRAFGDRAALRRRLSRSEMAEVVSAYAEAHDLRLRERQLLVLALDGVKRADMAGRLGLAEGTVKVHVRSLLRKTRERNLDALSNALLTRARLSHAER